MPWLSQKVRTRCMQATSSLRCLPSHSSYRGCEGQLGYTEHDLPTAATMSPRHGHLTTKHCPRRHRQLTSCFCLHTRPVVTMQSDMTHAPTCRSKHLCSKIRFQMIYHKQWFSKGHFKSKFIIMHFRIFSDIQVGVQTKNLQTHIFIYIP